MSEATIFELSSPGRVGFQFPESDVPEFDLPKNLLRKELELPELSEIDVIRHFTRLSSLNYSIDKGFYPLGSCTMKYNPRINEVTARLPGFSFSHPLQPVETVQGNLFLMFQLQEWLKEITGFKAVSLQPAAGAQGEFVGCLIIRAYHQDRKDFKRKIILVPDSSSSKSFIFPNSSSVNLSLSISFTIMSKLLCLYLLFLILHNYKLYLQI